MAAGQDGFVGFEWDPDESAQCYEKRGFDFEYAARIFQNDFIQEEDERQDWGEQRFVSVGEVEGRVLTVVWTRRKNNRRIISARPASRDERENFHDYRQAHSEANP